ncbi:MAG: hypothetical protein ABI434_11795 [Burkholderiaceae bacterium]
MKNTLERNSKEASSTTAPFGTAETFDPVSEDPVLLDKKHPPRVHEVAVVSAGVSLYGKVYSVQGTAMRPIVLIARGYPDMTSSADLALTLQRAGYNAMLFHYRGAWGMGGAFSLENSFQDLKAAARFLRSGPRSKEMLVDTEKIILFGFSFGGPIALRLAAEDDAIHGVLQLDGTDFRGIPGLPAEALATYAAELMTVAIPGAVGMQLLADIAANMTRWDPATYAPGLSGKDVCLLWASQGHGKEMRDYGPTLHDLYAATARVTEMIFDTDHDFSDHRIAIARATLAWLKKIVMPIGS